MKPRVALIILDGFGYRKETSGNGIAQADMKYYQSLWKRFPHTTLGAAGLEVGLPEGQMGNSEVGHLNIGAGRVVYQIYTRIDQSIANGDFFENPVLKESIVKAASQGRRLHLMGLLSDGGVHSHIQHFYALLKMAKQNGVSEVYVHALLDGRDVPPFCALRYLEELEREMARIGTGKIAMVMGRHYGMDRDNRWDRVKKAYSAMVCGEGIPVSSAREAVEKAYERKESDEFVQPSVVMEGEKPVAIMEDGDSVIFVNFRPDRARQISQALGLKSFSGFERKKFPSLHYATLAEYDRTFPFPAAFRPENMKNILAQVVADHGLRQLRIAETEKYAHVTFFFNGQIEEPFPGEDRVLIPSPQVATYDIQPEMSAPEVTSVLLEQIDSDKYDVIILNYANPDMVGHTGNLEATVQALQTIDRCLEKAVEKFLEKDWTVLLTADHGNAEEMKDESGNPMTAHTLNRVPFILIRREKNAKLREDGKLADIAPTILNLLGIAAPPEMTGKTLIKE